MLKFKKILTMFMSIALTLSGTLCASAKTNIEKDIAISSTSAIVSITANTVDASVQNILRSNGANITENTLIEVLPVGSNNDTAVCVTNKSNDNVTKDIYIAYTTDEKNELTIDNSMAEAIMRQGPDRDMSADWPPVNWDGRFIIHGVATAALYSDGFYTYYKPYKCQFSYEKLQNVNVSYINVKYIADGFLYSYPGFQDLHLDEYEHVVSVSKSNPATNTTYSNTKYFATDRVLMTSSGSPMVGHFLTFTATVNGSSLSYTVTL